MVPPPLELLFPNDRDYGLGSVDPTGYEAGRAAPRSHDEQLALDHPFARLLVATSVIGGVAGSAHHPADHGHGR